MKQNLVNRKQNRLGSKAVPLIRLQGGKHDYRRPDKECHINLESLHSVQTRPHSSLAQCACLILNIFKNE